MSRYLALGHAAIAWLLVVAVLVQVFLAGLFVFGQEQFRSGHIEFGYNGVGLAAFLVPVSAVVARSGRRQIGWSAVLFVLYIVQTALPLARTAMPVVAALHPVNALVLFALGVVVARRATALARRASASDLQPTPAGAGPYA